MIFKINKLSNTINIFEQFIKKIVDMLAKGVETTLQEITLAKAALLVLETNVEKAQKIMTKLQGVIND